MNNILCIFVLALCASASASSIGRIIGGGASLQNQFPYVVSLQLISELTQDTRGHFCGGILITPQHVLTSASCTYKHSPQEPPVEIVPSEFRVFAGSISLTEDNAERIRSIYNITRHPAFIGSPAHINDIAVIRLESPFNSSVISPLSLPTEDFVPAEYTQCVVAGWGAREGSHNASVNQTYARQYVSDWELCRFQYNTEPEVLNLFPSMICALPTENNAAGCNGDYGNALVCDGGLTGVLISSKKCSSSSAMPEVYTRVSNYTTWIRDVTGGASTFQPALAVLMMLTVVQLITAKIVS